ncbi:hypothetical protein U062_00628 [Gammaproteobacteria bacterium MOLA455]|nr:hypothetical protein U062_00628 [Gammaproteobacteria bacterium MOLA455]
MLVVTCSSAKHQLMWRTSLISTLMMKQWKVFLWFAICLIIWSPWQEIPHSVAQLNSPSAAPKPQQASSFCFSMPLARLARLLLAVAAQMKGMQEFEL